MYFEIYGSQDLRKQIPEGTLVFPRTRYKRKMVWNTHVQARRRVEPISRNDDDYSQRKRTRRISSNKCVGSRILQKQERWKIIDSLQRWFNDRRAVISHNHFRQPAECLRSNRGLEWRIGSANLWSCIFQHRETCSAYEWTVGLFTFTFKSCRLSRNRLRSTFRHRETCSAVIASDSKIFQRTYKVFQTCESTGFMRNLSQTVFRDGPWPGWWIWRRCWGCRWYTPPRDDDYSVPVGWIRG